MFYNINATEEINDILKQASLVAKDYNNSEIATEHLLYGILCLENSPACQLLNEFGVNKNSFLQVLKDNPAEKYAFEVDTDLSERAKRVFLIAQKLSSQLGHSSVDGEHLLFSILLSEGSVAISILEQIYNIELKKLQEKTLELLKQKKIDNIENVQFETLPEKLLEFGFDLTLRAKMGKLDPIIGREKEIQTMIEILARKTKNNPILIGEAGVGKSAVVEGLALKIAKGEVPDILKDKKIYSLNLSLLMSGTKFRGTLEQKLNEVISILTADQSIITFIDEIHTLYQAGSEKGEISPAEILKPYLARGEIQTVGATTTQEYTKNIEKDQALERRFQPIMVNAPSEENTIKILFGLKSSYENFHKVSIQDEAIVSAVKLSVRYITNRNLPDKALDLIDIASSKVKLKVDSDHIVTTEDVAKVVSELTNIPVTKITETEREKLLHFEDILHEKVIGQDEAIEAVSKAVRRARVGFKDDKRPIGSFIFLGQTGIGKTELAKAIAMAMFDDENSLIRIDMSEYMEQHSVSKLIGSPPGYVGYEEGGQLTDKVRKCPYCVILFDEVEKAHKDIVNILLQVLDEGRLTDGQGRLVNFQNTIIIMTSNAGASKAYQYSSDFETQKQIMLSELKKIYRADILNRFDLITVFKPLSFEEMAKICYLMINKLNKKLKEKGISIKLTQDALIYLIKTGSNSEYGARPLKRLIEQKIEDVIAEDYLEGKIANSSEALISYQNGKLVFTYSAKEQ